MGEPGWRGFVRRLSGGLIGSSGGGGGGGGGGGSGGGDSDNVPVAARVGESGAMPVLEVTATARLGTVSSAAGTRATALLRVRGVEPPAAAVGDDCCGVPAAAEMSTKTPAGGSSGAGVDIILVVDKSGSMSGAKLEQVKDSIEFISGELGPSDGLAIVAFNSAAKVSLALTRMDARGRAAAVAATKALSAGGGTTIRAGLAAAAAILSRRSGADGTRTAAVVLLSDGQDSAARGAPPVGAPVYTLGYGADHDAELMAGIAGDNGGAFTFVEATGAVRAAFAACLGRALAPSLAGVTLVVHACGGATFSSVSAGCAPRRARQCACPPPGPCANAFALCVGTFTRGTRRRAARSWNWACCRRTRCGTCSWS